MEEEAISGRGTANHNRITMYSPAIREMQVTMDAIPTEEEQEIVDAEPSMNRPSIGHGGCTGGAGRGADSGREGDDGGRADGGEQGGFDINPVEEEERMEWRETWKGLESYEQDHVHAAMEM